MWLRPRQAQQKFPVPEATLIMWMMAQLDQKEESERRLQEAAGTVDQHTIQTEAEISSAIGAAAAGGCREGGPANNGSRVEQQQTAGSEDHSSMRVERRLQEAAGAEGQHTAQRVEAEKTAEKNKKKTTNEMRRGADEET